jgi:hypothetical protein
MRCHGLTSLRSVFLVMEFLEHDLKTLQDEMAEPFLPSEIKTLLLQLTSAVDYLHDHWILHVRALIQLLRLKANTFFFIARPQDLQCLSPLLSLPRSGV